MSYNVLGIAEGGEIEAISFDLHTHASRCQCRTGGANHTFADKFPSFHRLIRFNEMS